MKVSQKDVEHMREKHIKQYKKGEVFTVDPSVEKRIRSLVKGLTATKSFTGSIIAVDEAEERDLSAGGISTGFQEIDDVLTGTIDKDLETVPGSGLGIPRGRIIEIMGLEAGGKTSLALLLAANTQREKGVVAFIDMEHALDITYARSLGVDMDHIILTQPDSGEEALSQAEAYVKKGVDLIIVDSVAALVPEKEMKGGMGDASMGSQARLMSQACRKLSGLMKPGGPTVVFINQIRMKLGVLFGNPETTSGGNALKFYASIRCDIRRIKKLTVVSKKDGERRVIGSRVKMETIKNKCAPPHRYVIYDILFNKGIHIPTPAQIKADKAADALRYGKK
jgi:recombination protein RecA